MYVNLARISVLNEYDICARYELENVKGSEICREASYMSVVM